MSDGKCGQDSEQRTEQGERESVIYENTKQDLDSNNDAQS